MLVALLTILLAVDGWIEYSRQASIIRQDMTRNAQILGRGLSGILETAWGQGGIDQVLEVLRTASAREQEGRLTLRWVWTEDGGAPDTAPRVDSARIVPGLSKGRSSTVVDDESGTLCTYLPVTTEPGRSGAVEIGQPLALLTRRTNRSLVRSVLLLLGLFAVSAATIVFIGLHLVGRPLEQLMKKAERAGAGDLSADLSLPGRGELSDLAEALNEMCRRLQESREHLERETAARLEALEHARHADRLRTVGRLASGMAHELGTPLNVVAGRAALITEGQLTGDQVLESAAIIGAQAERMTEIIRGLLAFARRSDVRSPTDVGRIVRQALDLVRSNAEKRGVTLDCVSHDDHLPKVRANPAELQQVFTNLLMNAIQATSTGGRVGVELEHTSARPPGQGPAASRPVVCIRVWDTGRGIPADQIPHVFEPFFTTKEVGEGTGLGLAIVHGILSDHGGWVAVESEVGKGSRFSCYLPEAQCE